MGQLFSPALIGKSMAVAVALYAGVGMANAAVEMQKGQLIEANVEYSIPAEKGFDFYYVAEKTGSAHYWLGNSINVYYDAEHTQMMDAKFFSYEHVGTYILEFEEGETYYFADNGMLAYTSNPMFKLEIDAPLEVSGVNPEANSVLTPTGYGQVDIWFNQPARAKSVTISTGDASSTLSVPTAYQNSISVNYVRTFNTWYADGTIKGGEEVTFTFDGLENNAGDLYNGDGVYSVNFIAAEQPSLMVSSKMPEVFKSYWLPTDEDGKFTFTFDRELGTADMTLLFGNLESETNDFYVERVAANLEGNTAIFDLSDKLRRPVDMVPSGTNYGMMSIQVNFTDIAGMPVGSPGQGTIGSYSYALNYEYVAPAVFAPSFWPEAGSSLAGVPTVELELSDRSKLVYTGADFTVGNQVYNVPAADITEQANGDVTTLVIPVPEAVQNTEERVVLTLSGMQTVDGVDHTNDIRAVYNGFTITSFELYSPDGEVITARALENIEKDSYFYVTTSIDSEELYIEYQVDDVTTGEVVKSYYNLQRTTDEFGGVVYKATFPANIKLMMGHVYHIVFTAYTSELDRRYGAAPIGTEYVALEGLTIPYQYASILLNSVDPAPDTEIPSTQSEFVYTFDGLVTVDETQTFINYGQGMTFNFAEIVNVDPDSQEPSYGNVWRFVLPEGYIENYNIEVLSLVTKFIDIEGRVVEGNNGTEENSCFYYEWTVSGMGVLEDFTVEPANDSVIKELSEITISSDMYPAGLNYNMAGTDLRVLTRFGEEVATIPFDNMEVVTVAKPGVEIPEDAMEGDDRYYTTVVRLVLDKPVTEAGSYMVEIPEGLVSFGAQFETYRNASVLLSYVIEGETPKPGESNITVTPAEGMIDMLSEFVISATNGGDVMPSWNGEVLTFTDNNGEVMTITADDLVMGNVDPDDFWSAYIYSYTFAAPYTENGTYTLEIPAGLFNVGDNGASSDALTIVWVIGMDGVDRVFGDATNFDVYTVGGVVVMKGGNAEQLNELPAGLYIINGKKVMIRK